MGPIFDDNGGNNYRAMFTVGPEPAAGGELVIATAQRTDAGFRVGFATQSNALYGIEYKTEMEAPSASGLTNGIEGTGGTLTITDADATNQPRRFYRVFLSK